jgi:RHS repeat-associated protein
MGGRGSVRGVVDNSVTVLHTSQFSPHGESYGQTGTNQTTFGFIGESIDNNGLVYLRARYLNPSLGQFISLDIAETLNRYLYALGDPVNLLDLNGMLPPNPFDISKRPIPWPVWPQPPIGTQSGGTSGQGGRMTWEDILGLPIRQLVGDQVVVRNPMAGQSAANIGSQNPQVTSGVGGAPADSTMGGHPPTISVNTGSTSPDLGTFTMPDGQTVPATLPDDLRQTIEQADNCARPNPDDEEKEQPRKYHLALGLGIIDSPLIALGVDLYQFASNLNKKYSHDRDAGARYPNMVKHPTVHVDDTWHLSSKFSDGKPLSSTYHYPLSFYQALGEIATGRVTRIHFNLEGILRQEPAGYREYADRSGNKGLWAENRTALPNGATFYATAWELYTLMKLPHVCNNMTLFYLNGTVSDSPDRSLNSKICDSISPIAVIR